MTDAPPPMPTADEQEKAFRQHMAFNVEAIRGGMFAAAIDMMETMRENNVAHADAILLTAAAEFTAQLWAQVGARTGVTPKKSRETLEKEIRFYLRKHRDIEAAQPVTAQ